VTSIRTRRLAESRSFHGLIDTSVVIDFGKRSICLRRQPRIG
jgi:hypothetical protein